MPDPTKQTISATESPALLNASPYLTRWMLWQRFANGIEPPYEENARMSWGKKLQPLIIQQVARERGLEVFPNQDTYARRGLLGCTRDAIILSPEYGLGALEIKCVFDYEQWGRKWDTGKTVPRDIEIQLQQQMYVGDDSGSFEWGLIVVWVCADLYYFERKPIGELWTRLIGESEVFFHSVKNNIEPNPSGTAVELPLLTRLFPTRPDSVLDLSDDPDHIKTSEDVSMFKTMKEHSYNYKGAAEELRIKLLALAKDNERVKLPCGVSYRVKKSGTGKTIDPVVPDVPLAPPPPKHDIVGII